ncbi:MAG: lysine biosynthesis protein LysW [Anaerolineae bacterium]|nr:lysine biosynthesis protein LysW [Anaerolineae bacterium]
MLVASCPECEARINFDELVEVKVGERVFCPECDIELEVISVKPPTLDYVFDDEDWEEDWDDE